ncbi:hypothetical protein, partial [Helicobacter sp.]|uniref:coiled-coil domain-containing protein n=1 Tax=Helicobacter sp. TaxID=218 RepID=UPI00258BB2A6
MTVYVHIGTMKTGTSSIQNFLYMNRDLLQEQNYYYPISIKNKNRLNDHNPFAHRFNAMLNKTNDLKLLYKEFNYLNNEVEKCNCGNIVISAENTQWLLDSQQKIEYFYNFLSLKFHNIKIVIYLRDVVELFISMCSQAIKGNSHTDYHCLLPYQNQKSKILSNYQQMLQWWGGIFGKKNLIVRLFDKNEFKDGDLLKDFVDAIGIEWDDSFKIPKKDNETLDLIGFELLCRVNKLKPFMFVSRYFDIVEYFDRNCTSGNKDPHLKFQPPKEIIQSYIDYFEESNEWVRKEFFPHKERLFPKKDLSNYRENYELKEMKPEYWDKIAELIVDIVKTKNQAIVDKITIIQNKDKLIVQNIQELQTAKISLDSLKQELTSKTQELTQTKNQLDSTKNQLDFTQKELDSKVKQMDSQIKILESSQNQ